MLSCSSKDSSEPGSTPAQGAKDNCDAHGRRRRSGRAPATGRRAPSVYGVFAGSEHARYRAHRVQRLVVGLWPHLLNVLRLSSALAAGQLGWRSYWGIAEVVERTIEWYRRYANEHASARDAC